MSKPHLTGMLDYNGYELEIGYTVVPTERVTKSNPGEIGEIYVNVVSAYNEWGQRLTTEEIAEQICLHDLTEHIQCMINGNQGLST